MEQYQHKFILSGGGTGGHAYPAIAIADALKEKFPGALFLFVGALGRMEMDKVPAAGYPIQGLWISGLQREISLKNLSFPIKVISSMVKARKIILAFKPDVVIGTGGYASGPTLRVASSLGIPTLIQEQNSYPGITNKILSKKVDKICVAYEGLDKYFPAEKIILTGNPVRKDIMNMEGKKDEALAFFGLRNDCKTILVIGGSLGARTINESIHDCLESLLAKDIQVIWQTGKQYFTEAETIVNNSFSSMVRVFPFISRMDMAYAAADMIVSRAGAIAISELCITAKACILIPSPNVAEDHQTKNAQALVDKEAAILIPDPMAREKLGETILSLFEDEKRMNKLAQRIGDMAHRNATELIVNEILGLIVTEKE
ncbi:MAG: undecaprenyldiphospho-muramoylpentapeptide beta-N-acetylglucosaminyltransferase [Bacteroidetes bacterium]|nr:undecaprenyldiphospho-muramoylpentapeptide beta-N-acetylglucosaminyltransferase [Bacteroidota bacterium]